MRWSYSASLTFAQCPRKWFYGQVLANARASDPLRKEAFLLKQLSNIRAWRGKLVDKVISDLIVPKLNNHETIDVKDSLNYANRLIETQLEFGKSKSHRNGSAKSSNEEAYCAFYELEYGEELDEGSLHSAKNDIHNSLQNFHNSDLLKEIISSQPYLIAQRSLQFPYSGVTVTSTPDLIAFFENRNPLIVDWKVQESNYKDHWLQLGVYAWAISKVDPHKDFPFKWRETIKDPTKLQLIEFQLLKNQERSYTLTHDDVLDVEDYFFNSSNQINILSENKAKLSELDLKMFPTAKSSITCMNCQFKKICWEEQNVAT
ncbi:MAG: PD-(D/E)XK nuclease family protein [Candidatus Nitrosotenuis sp.]